MAEVVEKLKQQVSNRRDIKVTDCMPGCVETGRSTTDALQSAHPPLPRSLATAEQVAGQIMAFPVLTVYKDASMGQVAHLLRYVCASCPICRSLRHARAHDDGSRGSVVIKECETWRSHPAPVHGPHTTASTRCTRCRW